MRALPLVTRSTPRQQQLVVVNKCLQRHFCEASESGSTVAEFTELSRLEIRSGKIMGVSRHPEADGLYVEEVDCGEKGFSTTKSPLFIILNHHCYFL